MNIKSKKGFTIIEVVLVLAIAGLIFLMVFIALPTMQRNQRDTQRRNDYSALSTNITNYMTNNGGRFPTACNSTTVANTVATPSYNTANATGICADTTKYVNSSDNNNNKKAEDPTGNDYKVIVLSSGGTSQSTMPEIKAAATTSAGSVVYVVQGADCNGTATDLGQRPGAKSGSRNFAIYGQLESGVYCLASQ